MHCNSTFFSMQNNNKKETFDRINQSSFSSTGILTSFGVSMSLFDILIESVPLAFIVEEAELTSTSWRKIFLKSNDWQIVRLAYKFCCVCFENSLIKQYLKNKTYMAPKNLQFLNKGLYVNTYTAQ